MPYESETGWDVKESSCIEVVYGDPALLWSSQGWLAGRWFCVRKAILCEEGTELSHSSWLQCIVIRHFIPSHRFKHTAQAIKSALPNPGSSLL